MKAIFSLVIFIIILVFLDKSVAQNLVPNSGFEMHNACPTTTAFLDYCYDWLNVENTPDYFHSCCWNNIASVPYNFFGFQLARSGCAYAGLYTYVANQSNYREFFQVKLNSALNPNTTYYFSFYANLFNGNGPCAGTKLGFKLSTMPYTAASDSSPSINNQATFITSSIVTDTIGWTFIQGSIVADSAYQFLTFGNFYDDLNTPFVILVGVAGNIKSYYYIDDVCFSSDSSTCANISDSCGPIQPVGISEPNRERLMIYPNPIINSEKIHLNIEENQLYTMVIYDNYAFIRHQYKGARADLEENLSQFFSKNPSGPYFISLKNDIGDLLLNRIINIQK